MAEQMEYQAQDTGKTAKILLVAFIVAAVGFNVFLMSKMGAIEDSAQQQRVALETKIADLEGRLEAANGARMHELAAIETQLDKARKEAASRSRSEAKRQSDRVAKTLAQQQREQQDMFLTEISGVRGAADANRDGIADVDSKVDRVQNGVDENREGLAETADLVRGAQGEIDSVAGRVDFNASAIARLRRMGENEVVRFELLKSKNRTRVENVQLRLRDVSANKNRYSIEILADDELIVQKNRYRNEPVEFYVTGARRPYEIVVTEVEKDRVSGYLAKPTEVEVASN